MSIKSEFLCSIQTSALQETERKFRKACDQIHLLNKQLEDVQQRYHHARKENLRNFRYNLRLKLASIEGVRNMYYDYAYAQAEIVAELRRQLYGESVDIITDNDDTEEMIIL